MALFPEIPSAGGPSLQNPIGLSGPAGELLGRAPSILFPLIPALLLVTAGALGLRFVRSRGMERQQLKWLAYAAGLNLAVALLPPGWLAGWKPALDNLASWGFPIAIGIAILRYRIQRAVDRRFNLRRYNAARTVNTFSARLRDQVDLDTLTRELLAVVDQTMQPTTASLWLRPPGRAAR